MNEPSVVFVVVNWNQRQLTLDCLKSLFEQHYVNFSVVVVDNGSQDDSVSAIREAFPQVVVCENGRNLGIAAANNIGIRYALDKEADYVFLLNNDTTVDPDMLAQLVSVAESEATIGMTGPSMLYFDQPDTIWCGGNRIDWRTGGTERLLAGASFAAVAHRDCERVDFITSCAVCIKSVVFRSSGLMDERFFIYYDETDWFARAAAAGWETVYVPQARMWHKVSATMGTSSPTTDYYMVRNSFLFLAKNLRGGRRLVALSRAGLHNLRTILAFTLRRRYEVRRSNRNAKLLGLRDACLGRWGVIPPEVVSQCAASRP